MNTIKEFKGPFSFLSNFGEGEAEYESIIYPRREYAYQAAKALPSFQIWIPDPYDKKKLVLVYYREVIKACKTPGEAKRLGKKARLRPDWNNIRYRIMFDILVDFFSKNPEMKRKLLETGDAVLEEGNNWNDEYWGINLKTGKGENNLGKILMLIRGKIKNEEI